MDPLRVTPMCRRDSKGWRSLSAEEVLGHALCEACVAEATSDVLSQISGTLKGVGLRSRYARELRQAAQKVRRAEIVGEKGWVRYGRVTWADEEQRDDWGEAMYDLDDAIDDVADVLAPIDEEDDWVEVRA